MKSLVIEDEPETSRYICNGLRESGHAVTCCDNGLDGLHQALNETWDLIIIDRLLPGGVDGLSIVAKLRDLGKRTPVLILSALTSTDERVRGLRQGGDDYISKPFALAELLARVEALLRPRELRLLTYLMRNEGQVVTRTMLLEAVWDCHFDPQTNVIDVQISRLRSKIDKGFSPPLIHTVRGAGYLLGERRASAVLA
jgi:two-component system OmpR family response regulator